MRFSLVMPTLNRREELVLFLESLKQQTFRDFELIVLDQNEGKELEALMHTYRESFEIIYIRSGQKGLSLNRNEGLKYVRGTIVAFPDDDCIYPADTLAIADQFFSTAPQQILTMNTRDADGSGAVVKLAAASTAINPGNFMSTGISFTIFVRYQQLADLYFDEQLGVGARYGSSEESDFILRLLQGGYAGYYMANHYIYHPAKTGLLNAEKGYNYGTGMGALFKKHIVYQKNYKLIPVFLSLLIKSTGGIILTNKRAFYFQTLKGRISGFLKYKKA